MGEYAKYRGQEIKIGTCEKMYYLRYEDRNQVEPVEGCVNAAIEQNLYWRLPFADEDHIGPGGYRDHNRGYTLQGFDPQNLSTNPGLIQLSHTSGLLVNVVCHHGLKLPEPGKDFKAVWNGQSPAFFELTSIKNKPTGLVPIISCRYCNQSWSIDWNEIREYITDPILKSRLDALFQNSGKVLVENKRRQGVNTNEEEESK